MSGVITLVVKEIFGDGLIGREKVSLVYLGLIL